MNAISWEIMHKWREFMIDWEVDHYMFSLREERARLYRKGSGDWYICGGLLREAEKQIRKAIEREYPPITAALSHTHETSANPKT